MYEHKFTFTELGEQLAQEPPIAAIVEAIWKDDEYPAVYNRGHRSFEDRLYVAEDLHSSGFYADLSDRDRMLAYHALGLARVAEDDDTTTWLVPGDDLKDTLFPGRSVVRRPVANADDGLLLAGATALDTERLAPDFIHRSSEFGFSSELDFAIFLGAAVLVSSHRTYDYVTEPIRGATQVHISIGKGMQCSISVGADMQGDFRMTQQEQYTDGAVSPFGQLTQFAPSGEAIMAGSYHHAELPIFLACLEHIHFTATPAERVELMEQTMAAIHSVLDVEKQDVTMYFANYGADPKDAIVALRNFLKTHKAGKLRHDSVRGGIEGVPGHAAPLSQTTVMGKSHIRLP
jgi:hypothetical protein